jgi:ribonuclease E
VPGADQPELPPVYAGPTPADPFGGRAFDIFDVMDQAERAAETQPASRTRSTAEIVNAVAPEPAATIAESGMALEAPTAEPAEPMAELQIPTADLAATVAERPEPAMAERPEPAVTQPDATVAEQHGTAVTAQHEAPAAEPQEPAISERQEASVAEHLEIVAAEEANAAEATEGQVVAVPASPEIVNISAPEPAPEAMSVDTRAEGPTPAIDIDETPAPAEPPPEPLVKPILVGAGGEPPVERKRGWWRR